MLQDDTLFAGSIADNISFFDPEATPLHIEAAARLAQIHADTQIPATGSQLPAPASYPPATSAYTASVACCVSARR